MILRAVLLVTTIILSAVTCSGTADATTWSAGEEITYAQSEWGDALTTAGQLLGASFDSVYPGGLIVGIDGAAGFSMAFFDALSVFLYLPAGGSPGPLTGDLVNPTSSPSGLFGGTVVALQLNVDFSDAGLLPATSGVPFGDLVLSNFGTVPDLNGLTVRQFLSAANTALGGGSSLFDIDTFTGVAFDLGVAFDSGTPTQFAQDHLVAPGTRAQVPEPESLLLLGVGAVGVAWRTRSTRGDAERTGPLQAPRRLAKGIPSSILKGRRMSAGTAKGATGFDGDQ